MSDVRTVKLGPEVEVVLGQMKSDTGLTHDELVSMAVFTLARLHGAVTPGVVAPAGAAAPTVEVPRPPEPARPIAAAKPLPAPRPMVAPLPVNPPRRK